jgi:hypothetical protein
MEQYPTSAVLGSALMWLLSAACPGVISAFLFFLVIRARRTGIWFGKSGGFSGGAYRRFTRDEDPGVFRFGTTITTVLAGFFAFACLLFFSCSLYFFVAFLSR